MLVSHHAALSAIAALVLAPHVRKKHELALFWGAAVGQDVDHYLWFAARYRNPSLADAYRFFRSRYGQPSHRKREFEGNPRPLHGPLPLALVVAATAVDRRLWPIAAGMAFHGLLDAIREYAVPDDSEQRGSDSRLRERTYVEIRGSEAPDGKVAAASAPSRRQAAGSESASGENEEGVSGRAELREPRAEELAPAGRSK